LFADELNPSGYTETLTMDVAATPPPAGPAGWLLDGDAIRLAAEARRPAAPLLRRTKVGRPCPALGFAGSDSRGWDSPGRLPLI